MSRVLPFLGDIALLSQHVSERIDKRTPAHTSNSRSRFRKAAWSSGDSSAIWAEYRNSSIRGSMETRGRDERESRSPHRMSVSRAQDVWEWQTQICRGSPSRKSFRGRSIVCLRKAATSPAKAKGGQTNRVCTETCRHWLYIGCSIFLCFRVYVCMFLRLLLSN
jgi:hypothetical protein